MNSNGLKKRLVFVYAEQESHRSGIVTCFIQERTWSEGIWLAGQKKQYTLADFQSLKEYCRPAELFERALKSEFIHKKLSGGIPSPHDDVTKIRLTHEMAVGFMRDACHESILCLTNGKKMEFEHHPANLRLLRQAEHLKLTINLASKNEIFPEVPPLPHLFDTSPILFIFQHRVNILPDNVTLKLISSIPAKLNDHEYRKLISRLKHFGQSFEIPETTFQQKKTLPPPPVYPLVKFNKHLNFAHLLFEYPHSYFISQNSTDEIITLPDTGVQYKRNLDEERLYKDFLKGTLHWSTSINPGLGDYYIPLENLYHDISCLEKEGIRILHENTPLAIAENLSISMSMQTHSLKISLFALHEKKSFPVDPSKLDLSPGPKYIQDQNLSLLLKNEHILPFQALQFNYNSSEKAYIFNRFEIPFLSQLPMFAAMPGSQDKWLPADPNWNPDQASIQFGFLRPYQTEGTKWIMEHFRQSYGCLLADEMGLGKTLQALCVLSAMNTIMPEIKALVILPKTLIWQWATEIEKFTPHLKHIIYHGTNRDFSPLNIDSHILLTTYHTAKQDVKKLSEITWDILVLDEAHLIKNPEAQITSAVKNIHSKFRLAMSGTPIMNRLDDMCSIFSFLHPGRFNHKSEFTKHMETPEAIQNFKKKLSPFILRRTKSEVIKELPQKQTIDFYCPFTLRQEEIYNTTLKSTHKLIEESGKGIHSKRFLILEKILRLRQIACHPALALPKSNEEFDSGKTACVADLIFELIGEGKKILVFSQFTKHLQLIRKYLGEQLRSYYLDGKTQNRDQQINEFKADPNPCALFLSLKAFGVGLNLTEASYVILLDPWWNSAAENQAIDRCHRIGQTEPVTVYKLITKGSIEENVLKLNLHKAKLSASVLDNQPTHNISGLTTTDLLNLI